MSEPAKNEANKKPPEEDPNLLAIPAMGDRLTMVLRLYHESPGEEPISTHKAVDKFLEESEQPWVRRITVTEHSSQIDLGWFTKDNAGLVCLENTEGCQLSVNPTKEEAKQTSKKIVEVRLSQDDEEYLSIPPGWAFPILTSSPNKLTFRCQSGTAKCRLFIFPR